MRRNLHGALVFHIPALQAHSLLLSPRARLFCSELGGSDKAKEYLRTLCGCNAAFVDMHIAAFESGKKAASMDKYVSSASAAPPNAQGMSAMYGAWMACFGDKNHVAFLRA